MELGSRAVIRSLEAQGVEHVFGVCGDTSVGLYRDFHDMDHNIDHILARDERGASYMADAYGRLSKKPGVCEGPSGGGATYLIPGLAEANDSSIPVVGINTNIPVKYRGRGVLTELNQGEIFANVTKWNAVADHADLVPRLIRQAFRKATVGRPGATHLSFPMDVLNTETDQDIYEDKDTVTYPAYRPEPDLDRLDAAAEVVEKSESPVIVVGGGIHSSRAWDELKEYAETTGIPVAQTLTSAGCIGNSPYSIGVVGENGSREYANEIIAESDTVIIVGSAVESVWTDKWSRPADGEKEIIHIDIDGESIGLNYQTTVSLPGDLKKSLDGLLKRTEEMQKWSKDALRDRHSAWIEPYRENFSSDEFPIRPERMVAGAREVLDDDAVIISDPGTACPYFASLYEFRTVGRNWVTPRAHGALGYTIPGVLGAYYARPDSQIIGFTGDGSFGMTVGDLETIARRDIPVTIVVVNNGAFSWIEAGQRNFSDFSFGVDFDGMDYAAIAEEFGLNGFTVENAEEYEETLQEAVELEGPAVVNLPTQPLPTLPDTPVSWLEPDE